jgi:hypothetical protein
LSFLGADLLSRALVRVLYNFRHRTSRYTYPACMRSVLHLCSASRSRRISQRSNLPTLRLVWTEGMLVIVDRQTGPGKRCIHLYQLSTLSLTLALTFTHTLTDSLRFGSQMHTVEGKRKIRWDKRLAGCVLCVECRIPCDEYRVPCAVCRVPCAVLAVPIDTSAPAFGAQVFFSIDLFWSGRVGSG